MKEIKREVTKEQIVYEITKEELNKIKREARNEGRQDVLEYIRFAIKRYRLKMNFGGITEFFSELVDFVCQESHTIRNTVNYSFWDYINNFR